MTQHQTINRLGTVGVALIVAALASFALAGTATALTVDPDSQRILAEEDKPTAPEPPIDEGGDVADRIAPAPEEPFFPPATTLPARVPNIDAANFGVGWPAAIAAGAAVLAVLIMALMWRRDEPSWIRSPDRR